MLGVLDSGVGGLTVLHAVQQVLPGLDFVYVADSARYPYGRKPKDLVTDFSMEIACFLKKNHNISSLLIACNTATALVFDELSQSLPFPVWGVIEPGVQAARSVTQTGHVGLIGTESMVKSGVYQKKLEAQGLAVWAKACPLFVHVVEEGLGDSPAASLLAEHYLKEIPITVDTVILGCTHYPFLASLLRAHLPRHVQLVDSAQTTAQLLQQKLQSDHKGQKTQIHYVTGDPRAFQHTAQLMGVSVSDVRWLEYHQLAKLPSVQGDKD